MLDKLEVSGEFIEESKTNLGRFRSNPHKRGPYTQSEKQVRRNEVYKLHFDYDFSARKISELMKIHRNTINGDVSFWYSKIIESGNIFDPETSILVTIERLKIQRARLRELLDKPDSIKDTLSIERLLFDINAKILYTHHRLAESSRRMLDSETERLNAWMKDNRKETRFLTLSDRIEVSSNAHEKIKQIIEEDKKMRDPDFN